MKNADVIGIVLLFVAWVSAGVSGLIFWWTHDFDFTSRQVPLCFVAAIMGPLAWFIGWIIHGGNDRPSVLLKRRALVLRVKGWL